MAQRPPTHSELEDLAARADAAPSGSWRRQEGAPLAHFTLRIAGGEGDAHLYAPGGAAEAVARLLEAAREDVPRLVSEVRRLRDEVEALQSERASRPAAKDAPKRAPAAAMEIDEDAPIGLAAPFHVGPKEMKAAATDPLAALSVQVARALLPDAKEIERARLIAMAFAATRGQMDDFWAARKMRTAGKKGAAKKK
jgi:cell division septum initiation protein DivIVA